MKADLRRLDPNVVLAAVSAVLRAHKRELAEDLEMVLGPRSSEIGGRTPDTVWTDAAEAAGADLPADLRGRVFLATEYAMVVLPAGPAGVWPWTARSESRSGRPLRPTEPEAPSRAPSTSPRRPPSPPLLLRNGSRNHPAIPGCRHPHRLGHLLTRVLRYDRARGPCS